MVLLSLFLLAGIDQTINPFQYYPGFRFYERPDYIYLTTKKGCTPSNAFAILERGSKNRKCSGELLTQNFDFSNGMFKKW